VALEIDKVAGLVSVAGVEEVVEADFEDRGERLVGGDVATDAVVGLVLAGDHSHGIPANNALDAPFEGAVAGIRDFGLRGDGVDEVGRKANRHFNARPFCMVSQFFQEESGPVGACAVEDLIQSFEPLFCFAWIEIVDTFGQLLMHGG